MILKSTSSLCKFVKENLRKAAYMYFFRKKDPNRPTNFNLRVMHAINAIAITVFLAGIIWKVLEWIFMKKI